MSISAGLGLTLPVAAQIALTVVILVLIIFFLGFVADPIINLYVDPWSFLSPWSSYSRSDYYFEDDEPFTWYEHFAKGFASMGVLGFLKVLVASPLSYFRIGGGRGRTAGRDRYEQVSWIIILIGVGTFLAVCNRPFPMRTAGSLNNHRRCTKAFGSGAAERLRKQASESWMSKATMTTRTSRYDGTTNERTLSNDPISMSRRFQSSIPYRTFLNCHMLFLNTVSISLRAKIELLTTSIPTTHVLCRRPLERAAIAIGSLVSFFSAFGHL